MTCRIVSLIALLLADDLKAIFEGNRKKLMKLKDDLNNLCWSTQNHLLFNYKKSSVTEFKNGHRKKSPIEMDFMFGDNLIEKDQPMKNVGLVINENLTWSDHVNYQIGKAMKALFLQRRSTSPLLSIESNVHLYRAVLSQTLFFASERLELRRSEYHLIESFQKKAMRWIYGNVRYKLAMMKANVLSPLYFKVLKNLKMFIASAMEITT